MPDLPTILTIGYEKRSIDDLIWLLQARHVERVVDVRLTPASRRPDFAEKRLSSSLEAAAASKEELSRFFAKSGRRLAGVRRTSTTRSTCLAWSSQIKSSIERFS